jgi:hypothetical protein
MNAIKVYENAERKLEHGWINLGQYEDLIKPLENVISIPKGTTNLDILKVIFPNLEEISNDLAIRLRLDPLNSNTVLITSNIWLNAPYKGVNDEE